MSAYAESDARQQACEFCSNSGIKVFDGVGDNSDNRIDALAELSQTEKVRLSGKFAGASKRRFGVYDYDRKRVKMDQAANDT